MLARLFMISGALSAAISVVLGAVAAHTLAGLAPAAQSWFHTAMQYQQLHALGLLIIGHMARAGTSRWIEAAGLLMLIGTLLFSGSLYLRSLADYHALRALTPFGGGAFILAWLALATGIVRRA